MGEYEFLIYERLDEGRVGRVLLNRPETRNAQGRRVGVEVGRGLGDTSWMGECD